MNLNLWIGAFLNWLYNDIVTHIPIHIFRIGFLRLFNKNIHPTSKILLHSKFLNFWKISIGPRVIINQYCLLDCRTYSITIEEDVDIGPYTRIWTLGHDPDDSNHSIKGGNVIIKDHVWIASSVTILPGILIERGAVIASNSVLSKNAETLGVYAGNPARKIRDRKNTLNYTLNFEPIFQ